MNFMANYTEQDIEVGDKIIVKGFSEKYWTIIRWDSNINTISGYDGESSGSFEVILECLNQGSHILEKAKSYKFQSLYEKLK